VPTIKLAESGGYRVSFYMQDCEEPRHVHIERGDAKAKYWLDPIKLAHCNRRFTSADRRKAEALLRAHLEFVRDEWDRICRQSE
jgi:Domain of unknown function (DUF4160)